MRNAPKAKWLPGERVQQSRKIEKILRVDHAGEFGARRIYAGQLAVLGHSPQAPVILDMAKQENEHFAAFDKAMKDYAIRPTALMPLWNILGYALGAATAALGPQAAMACTVAVEETIVAHYSHQLEALGHQDPALRKLIMKCRDDEDEHRKIGLKYGAQATPAYSLLRAAIQSASRLAIALSEKI
ncbi:MAG: demethoxyubiquinone hydroxylase family protein [Bdellovibrionales bacterium]